LSPVNVAHSVLRLNFGVIGYQNVDCIFKDDRLVACYFSWDREELCNVKMFFVKDDIEMVEMIHLANTERTL
jgi:hypothetical protein